MRDQIQQRKHFGGRGGMVLLSESGTWQLWPAAATVLRGPERAAEHRYRENATQGACSRVKMHSA